MNSMMEPSPRWQVVAASACGSSHERLGKPCQDAHKWEILPSGVLVAAVADGAGSAALSEAGSATSVQTAVSTICAKMDSSAIPESDEEWQSLLKEAFQSAQTGIEMEALAHGEEVRSLATTLTLAVATPQSVAAAQIGDGSVIAGDCQGNLITIATPQSGEYLNETDFLTSPEAIDLIQFNVWRGETGCLFLFSDGLQRIALKMPEAKPHAPFFFPLSRFVSNLTDSDAKSAQGQLLKFLSSSRIRDRTDDDLTLLLAVLIR